VRDLRHLSELVRRQGPPLVLKPVDSRGARGVVRLGPDTDLAWAFESSRRHSPGGRTLLERFVAGPQLSTESLLVDGACHTPGLADRNYEHLERFRPWVIEDGGDLPTALPAPVVARVRETVARAAASLGVRDGVVKGDLVIEDGRPVVIELAARLSGGYFCSHHIPLSTGVDLIGAAIRVAVGERVDPAELAPRLARGVSQRFLFPEPGRVVAVEGVEAVAARPEIALCEIRVRTGGVVEAVENHPGRAGLVVATAPTRAEATARACDAVAAIRIRTEPLAATPRAVAGATA
jgi:biotin carboxylase